MENKQIQQEELRLNNWTDLWFNEHKKAGYIGITKDFKNYAYYGADNVKQLELDTKFRVDRFLTVNGFLVNPVTKQFKRDTENLRQIRNIAIDIDQYNLGLTISAVLEELKSLISNKEIPEPNLVLTSRGIQLFYTIDKGASPVISWLTSMITEQFVGKLKHLGADSQAIDVSRLMRVPNSINSRNKAVVKPLIWNDKPYSIKELESYCIPLSEFKPRTTNQNHKINLTIDTKLTLMYKTNHARLRDLRKLIEIREGNLTGMRNTFLYIYSYLQTLVLKDLDNVLNSVKNTFSGVYSTKDKKFSSKKLEETIKDAYEDAKEFFEHIEKNNYIVKYKTNDGIKKPYTTKNLIKKLNITTDEQRLLGSIRSKDVKKEHERARAAKNRRNRGIQTKEQYETKKEAQQLERINKLTYLMKKNPTATQRELAEMMGVSHTTINKLKRIIER